MSTVCTWDWLETTLSLSVKLPADVLPISFREEVDDEVSAIVFSPLKSLPVVVCATARWSHFR